MYEFLEGEHIVLRKAKEDDYKSMLKNVWGDSEVYQWILTEDCRNGIIKSQRM